MADRAAIIPDMPIFGSDGVFVGKVHRVSGVRIIVDRIGVSDADQHVIPLAQVAEVGDRVTLRCPAIDAGPERAGPEGRRIRLFGPLAVLAIGVLAIAAVVVVGNLLLRAPRAPAARGVAAASGRAARPVVAAMASRPVPVAPAAVATYSFSTAVAVPASTAALTQFLDSDAPTPQRFTLDTISFASGSVRLDAAGSAAVRSIAAMMTTRLNVMVKLGATNGLDLRRAAIVRNALIGYGVAGYRVTSGPRRGGGAKTGLELVILRK